MTEEEIWKPVVGYEGAYEVSNLGRVCSLDRRVPWRTRWGTTVTRFCPGTDLRLALSSTGYLTVNFGVGGTKAVHKLVLEAFEGGVPKGQEVLHRDGVKTNNVLSNLRYGTKSENGIDVFHHGGRLLNAIHIAYLRERQREGFYHGERKDLAERWGVSRSTIQDVIHGRTYKHAD